MLSRFLLRGYWLRFLRKRLDTTDTSKFFSTLWPQGYPHSNYLHLWMRAPNGASHTYATARIEAAVKLAQARNGLFDIFYHIATSYRYIQKGRQVEQDAAFLPGVWLDLDSKSGKSIKWLAEWAEGLLHAKPSMIVVTGHGIHPYWLFNAPVKADKTLLTNWHTWAAHEAELVGFAFDNTSELARVLRVPGTLNIKSDPVECFLAQVNNVRYDVSEIPQMVPEYPKFQPTNMTSHNKVRQGNRNNTLHKAVCSHVARIGGTIEQAIGYAIYWNNYWSEHPEDERAVLSTARSAWHFIQERNAREERLDKLYES